jgi:hypothetical protein
VREHRPSDHISTTRQDRYIIYIRYNEARERCGNGPGVTQEGGS